MDVPARLANCAGLPEILLDKGAPQDRPHQIFGALGKPGCENDSQTGRGLALAKSLTHRGTSALYVTEANWMPNLFLPDLTRIPPTTGLSLPNVYAQTTGDHGATWDCSDRGVRLRDAGARPSPQLFRNPPQEPPTHGGCVLTSHAGDRRVGQVRRRTLLVAGAILLFGSLVLLVGSVCRSPTKTWRSDE